LTQIDLQHRNEDAISTLEATPAILFATLHIVNSRSEHYLVEGELPKKWKEKCGEHFHNIDSSCVIIR
jgi:hypothetical protein